MLIKVNISDMAVDTATNSPILLLKEEDGDRVLPIWIGVAEASAIAIHRSAAKPERPLTHDLLKNIIQELGASVAKVVINNLKNNTFYAEVEITNGDETIKIDSRPSDAIALALRCESPIFVSQEIMEAERNKASPKNPADDLKANELRENLRRIDPSDFGKYSL